jgi:hypothetical protein
MINSFKVEPLIVEYEGLPKYILSFYEKLDSTIAQSNHEATKVFDITEDGYDIFYVHLVDSDGKVYGLACLNYDPTNLGGHRCYIRHFSTISASHFKTGLQALIEYIWKEILCDDIRVEIYHFKDESGTQKVDPNVKAAYTELGFRWKTLTNNPTTGKRA